jgi:hypothetical protein
MQKNGAFVQKNALKCHFSLIFFGHVKKKQYLCSRVRIEGRTDRVFRIRIQTRLSDFVLRSPKNKPVVFWGFY